MSRARRPLRHVRGADRRTVVDAVAQRIGGDPASARWLWHCQGSGWLPRLSRRLGCRPAQLRRCLLERPVHARAVARILAALRGSGSGWRW